jgi:hypothetical protein
MKKFYWMCVFLCCYLVPGVSAQAEKPVLKGGAMLSCSGLPCVDISLKNGRHLHMLVDLGDADSIVDSAVAKDIGLSVKPALATDRNGKLVSSYGSALLEGVRLGDASLGDVPVLVTDLASRIKKGQIPPADGVLAYSAFHDRLLQMDFKRQTVRVSEPLTAKLACPGFCGDVTMPTFGKKGPPVLVTTGFSVNGKPITAQIDTLFIGTVVIYPDSVAKLDLQEENKAGLTQFFHYTDGGVSMREARIHTEAFGPKVLSHKAALFFATPQVHVPDGMFDGTVGLRLLIGHVITLDLHSQHFWIAN